MIIEYQDSYLEKVRDLLVELEEYIISIDQDKLDRIHPKYREKMALFDLKEVEEKKGKCYLYLEDGQVKGMIMGIIRLYEEIDSLDYTCPKMGQITELIVSKKARSQGIGSRLIETLTSYFKEENCEYIELDVLAYNESAIKFYKKEGYHTRMMTMIKKMKA